MAQFSQLEFHRYGIGLAVAPDQGVQSWAMLLVSEKEGGRSQRSCSCELSRKKTCPHLKEVSRKFVAARKEAANKPWLERFEASLWCRLARMLFDGEPEAAAGVEASILRGEEGSVVRVTRSSGSVLVDYLEESPARIRFLERIHKGAEEGVPRAQLLDRLALNQATPEERRFAEVGMKIGRQVWEESFWHRLAYHGFREFGQDDLEFAPAIDTTSGDFQLAVRRGINGPENQVLCRMTVPRDRVRAVLKFLAAELPDQPQLQIHPIPLKSLFQITPETELDLEVRPVIRLLQASGEARFFDRDGLERFRYGQLVYIPELEVLAELERPGRARRFKAPQRVRLAKSQVPSFLSEYSAAVDAGALVLDPALGSIEVHRDFDNLRITSGQLEGGAYHLAASYAIGGHHVPLADVIRGRAEGRPYLEVGDGWVDLNAPVFAQLDDLASVLEAVETKGGKGAGEESGESRVRLTPSSLLRLRASTDRPVEVDEGAKVKSVLERLLDLRPATSFRKPKKFRSELRPYQVIGVDWLRWVWENRLAGLLADDMGLGKTHQAMALMSCLQEESAVQEPMLVVCPTTVISHWRKQISTFAPGLSTHIYHGPQRDLVFQERPGGTVVLTSYGVLRRDTERLGKRSFSLVIFDEIQHLKNRGTLGYRSAEQLEARVKIGLTGTPIENALEDLKALFDLLLPGYLGSDRHFSAKWGRNAEPTQEDLVELRRLIQPFVLRRTKQAVLDELPPKFEEQRGCQLSPQQVELYRAAAESRGRALVKQLANRDKPVPYIHIFALLNYLKRVCDHPALAEKDLDHAADYQSGKWDLFCEILDEALASGHKVVVFSQYLGMITLMSRHLESLGVGYESLTGASKNRGARIDRFNEDPACRVFLGSLKAGGTGIDLIGGSVVIHYDRWWNAAREDQATDRVYRMGQKKAVHVVKLVMEGTLEEKIAAIIENKRQLMNDLIQEDDPKLSKVFSRDELLALLAPI